MGERERIRGGGRQKMKKKEIEEGEKEEAKSEKGK